MTARPEPTMSVEYKNYYDFLVTLGEALHGSTRTINLQRVDSRTGQTSMQTFCIAQV
jgi:hypothetical protein